MDKNKLLRTIIETVATMQNVTPEDIGNAKWQSKRWGISRRCPTKIAIAKQIVCYLSVKYPIRFELLKVGDIGLAVGHKDHKSVRKYYKITANRMDVDMDFCTTVLDTEQLFLKNVMCVYNNFSGVNS
ncbi:hypothetical protein JST56_07190 [Candidatus Dependentiae bacterium]|nr:hypothetical protein [Candidatus Dependentiae bacterium]